MANIKAEYTEHLPYQSSFESEVATWKVHVAEMSDQGTDLLSTCNFADENKVFYIPQHAHDSLTTPVSHCWILLV